MPDWARVAAAIAEAEGQPCVLAERRPLGGGCVNQAWLLRAGDGTRRFLKCNRADLLGMFQAEAAGLEEIRASGTLRVPRPIHAGTDGGEAWLILEYLELTDQGDGAALGRGLAAMHRRAGEHFGWRIDNTIGSTPQDNAPLDDWLDFWRLRRLLPQLRRAAENGLGGGGVSRGERLAADLDGLFPGYVPVPSLLHGDLWGGNVAYADGRPTLFDPAVYYGDREADLAMTELFGGFGRDFHAAYGEAWPLDPGYATRKELYNLYHVLNHFNMFGGGYGAQATRMIDRLRAALA
jgi:fructosamine-3-kinase